MVDLNRTSETDEEIGLLDTAGLPRIAKYNTPIIRYHEHSPYYSDNPTKHLLVQLALTGDAKRLQVLVVEANRRSHSIWEITRSRLVYGSPEIFQTAAPAIIATAGRLPHYTVGAVQVCSHVPSARINVRIRGEIDLERGGPCQRDDNDPAVAAGRLVISAAEKVLREKIEPAANFGD